MPSLTTRAGTTRTRAGGVGSQFTSSRDMAATFRIRASNLKGNLRKAHGQAGSVVFQRRSKLLKETIYERAPTNRPFTYRLYASEKLIIAGNEIQLTNTAPYAGFRHAMSGISKTYGHRLDSFWASRAMQQTASTRAKIYRDALAATWNVRT